MVYKKMIFDSCVNNFLSKAEILLDSTCFELWHAELEITDT